MSFSFGKHKSKSVDDVAASDPGYLKWVLDTHNSWNKPPPAALIAAIRAKVGGGAVPDNGKPGVVTQKPAGTVSILLGAIAPRPEVGATPAAYSALSVSDDTINFGKYKSQPLSVLIADKSYATWCLGQDFFKRNKHYSKVAAALGVKQEDTVTSIYTSGDSGIFVLGDNNTCTFGKYKGQPLSKMLADPDYCKWVAEKDWERKPRHFDQIVEAAKNAKPKASFAQQDEPWEPPEDDYELDDAPFEPPEDDYEVDDAPLEDPDEVGEINDAPLEDPDEEVGQEDETPLEAPDA